MKFRPKIEKIIKINKKMSSPHNFVDFDDENHNDIRFTLLRKRNVEVLTECIYYCGVRIYFMLCSIHC